MVAAVLFDLYDVLIHFPRNTVPYTKICAGLNCLSRNGPEWKIAKSQTLKEFCDHIGVEPPENVMELQSDLDKDIQSACLFDDAIETLKILRDLGIRIGVVSSVARPYDSAFYNLGLNDYVDVVKFSSEVGVSTPNREIHEMALTELGVDASNALAVGDFNRFDVIGAVACSIPIALIDRERTTSIPNINHTLDSVIMDLK